MNKFFKITLLISVPILLYWLFIYKPDKNVFQIDGKKFNVRQNRTLLKRTVITTPKKIISIEVTSDNRINCIPFEENDTQLYIQLDSNNKLVKSVEKQKGAVVLLHKIIDTSSYFIIQSNEKFICIKENGGRFDSIYLNIKADSYFEIDSNLIIYSNLDNGIYSINKLDYTSNKLIDSINISNILKTQELHKELIYFGRLIASGDNYIYKSIYSSFGISINRYNFNTYKIFQSLDSINLPTIKTTEIAKGIFQNSINPSIYPAWQLVSNNDSSYYILSFIGVNQNTHFLDLYENQKYKKSYLIPHFGKNRAYWVAFNKNKSAIYVLYDDYSTIIKYFL